MAEKFRQVTYGERIASCDSFVEYLSACIARNPKIAHRQSEIDFTLAERDRLIAEMRAKGKRRSSCYWPNP